MSGAPPTLPTPVMGADFLRFLLTRDCINPDEPPSDEAWQEMDFSRYGKTEAEIKRFLEQKAQSKSGTAVLSLTGYFYADLLNQALSQGLIYRLNNPQEDGKAYYGVPENVRREVGLFWTQEETTSLGSAGTQPIQGDRLAFANALKGFFQMLTGQESSEVREYAAQLAINAVHQNDLSLNDVSASLWQAGQALGLIAAPHYAGLTILLEACTGTPLFKAARQLCYVAVDANLLPAEDIEEVLNPTSKKPENPFMVLN